MLHLPSALRTECLGTLRKTTVMAHQPSVGAVIGHRHAAAGTLRHAAALAAKQHPAVAAAIQKQNTLLAAVKVFFEFCAQRCADNPAVAAAQLFLHVGKHHFRQGFSIITLPQFDTAIQALLGGIGSFYGRRSRTQHQGCLILCAQILRHLSRMIARRIFRLIRAFLLLVQVPERPPHAGSASTDRSALSYEGRCGASRHASRNMRRTCPSSVASGQSPVPEQ